MAFNPRFLHVGKDHFFLLGPRGTGKTLWCARQYPEALRVDLLDPATLRVLSAQPERLSEMVEAATKTRQVFIDQSRGRVARLPSKSQNG
jgi:hypothetical protein